VLAALGQLISSVLAAVFDLLRFLVERPRLGVLVVGAAFLILLANHVHDFWLLPIGVALLLWGGRLRVEGH
jgi:hypothetical protein